MDFDDFFYSSIFSRFFSTFPKISRAHLRTVRVTAVENRWSRVSLERKAHESPMS
jgi:hypothetical protein